MWIRTLLSLLLTNAEEKRAKEKHSQRFVLPKHISKVLIRQVYVVHRLDCLILQKNLLTNYRQKPMMQLLNHVHFFPDFTLNDCANAPKPVGRVKKSTVNETVVADIPWDQVPDDAYDHFDIVEEINADGTKNLVYKKKSSKSEPGDIEDRPGVVYPEIVWYQISKYVKPEDIGNFAGINKTTYAITGQKSFWRAIYKRYCEINPKLPDRLKIENSYKNYGLRQRVIRALYHTYDVFIQEVFQQSFHDCKPHELVRRRCVNVWFCKGATYWSIFFKFKKMQPMVTSGDVDIIKELGRIDANPEESSQVLEVCFT